MKLKSSLVLWNCLGLIVQLNMILCSSPPQNLIMNPSRAESIKSIIFPVPGTNNRLNIMPAGCLLFPGFCANLFTSTTTSTTTTTTTTTVRPIRRGTGTIVPILQPVDGIIDPANGEGFVNRPNVNVNPNRPSCLTFFGCSG